MFRKICAGVAAALIAASSQAQLVDRGGFLFDPSTNLDWLKLETTKRNSYDQVQIRTAEGGDLFGWELASQTQVRALFDGLVGPASAYPGTVLKCDIDVCLLHTNMVNVAQSSWVQPMFSTFGVSEYSPTPWLLLGYPWSTSSIYGLISEPHKIAHISNGHGGYDAGVLDEGIIFGYPELAEQSAFLVRSAIPEPATEVLFMIGAAALAFRLKTR